MVELCATLKVAPLFFCRADDGFGALLVRCAFRFDSPADFTIKFAAFLRTQSRIRS